MCLVVTVLDLSSLPPESKNRRMCVLTRNVIVLPFLGLNYNAAHFKTGWSEFTVSLLVWRWLYNVDLSKRKTWRHERQSIQRLLLQKNRRKPWFTPKVQLVDHLYTFLVAKDLRIWKASRYLQMETYKTCRLTKSNGRFIQPKAWGIETITLVTSRLLVALYQKYWSPEIFHRGFRNNSAT